MSNAFKAAMHAGTPQIGLWLTLANPYCAEVCASSGFQWLLIDGEHSPNDVRSILAQLQAVHGYPAHPIVRVVEGQTALIKQVLDIGATTLLVPMIDTAEQARAMVAATRYPPEGIRGVGAAGARAARWGARTDYVSVANGEICLLVQAETATAMANLEAICAVDGVDGVFIGPADLSASLGHLGNAGHPDVQAVIERGIQTIRGCGKAAGILTSDAAQARRYLELGATFVAVGLDVALFARATRQLANDFGVGLAALPSAEQQRQSGPY